jgi:ABC-type transport system involved in multi-copper enzyme maturation permease subunit
MSGLHRALRAEWFRLRARRWPLALGGSALAGAGYALALSLAVESNLLGSRSGFYLAAAAGSGAALTAAAIGALVAATSIGGDRASGLLRTLFSRSIGRGAWLAGRVLTLTAGLAALFLAACLGALLAGLARFGLPAAIEGDYVIAGRGLLASQLLAAAGLSLLAQSAAVALGAGLGAVIGRSALAVVAAGLLAAVLLTLDRWKSIARLLPIGPVTDSFDRLAQLSQGIAGHPVGEGALGSAAVCLAWLVGALALGGWALGRGDIVT